MNKRCVRKLTFSIGNVVYIDQILHYVIVHSDSGEPVRIKFLRKVWDCQSGD